MYSILNIYQRFYYIYILLFIFFLVFAYNSFPAFHDACMQIFMLLFGWVVGYSIIKTNGRHLYAKIFIFQALSVLLKVAINKTFYGDFVGPNAVDALEYRNIGEMYGRFNYSKFFHEVLLTGKDYDDWGFYSIIWLCYNCLGSYGYLMLLCLNIIAVSTAAYRLYRLSAHFIDRHLSLLLVAVWGVMPFSIETAVGFLKENFFSLIVISTFYHLYKFIDHKAIANLLFAIAWGLLASFFRMALGYAILLSLFSAVFINSRFLKKHLLSVALFTIVPLIIFVPLIISFLLSRRGITIEALLFARIDGTIGVVVDFLAGFIGPFPKFIGDFETVHYITFSSFSSLVKALISPYFWLEFLTILKNGKTRYLPILIFILCNLFMIVISHFAIQLRFQWPHMAIFFLMALIGFNDFGMSKNIQRIYKIYVFVLLFVVYKYNFGL